MTAEHMRLCRQASGKNGTGSISTSVLQCVHQSSRINQADRDVRFILTGRALNGEVDAGSGSNMRRTDNVYWSIFLPGLMKNECFLFL